MPVSALSHSVASWAAMQSDLFDNDSCSETEYAAKIKALVEAEEDYFINNGIIPPWIESDYILARDERRLLTMVADSDGYCMRDDDYIITPYGDYGARRVSRFTFDMGMQAEANSKAVLNSAIARGLVKLTRDNSLPGIRIDMTKKGRYFLDLAEDDDWWESGGPDQ